MKYTNYIINIPININQLVSNKRILKPITLPIALLVACTCFIMFIGLIPSTLVIDWSRYLKYQYHIYLRKFN